MTLHRTTADRHAVTRGLTLGKFASLHRGHQLVVETGLAETDEMVVIVYDAPPPSTCSAAPNLSS